MLGSEALSDRINYDKILQDYRREIKHAVFLVESKKRLGKRIKESFDVINKFIETLDDVPEDVKKEIRWIYNDLKNIDTKYESLMHER